MTLKLRPYTGENDWQTIAALIQSDPLFHHPIDFPWQFCSTSLEDHRNAALWEDETGHLQAFAALQFPWLTFDYAIRPASRSKAVEAQIIEWGETRLQQIAEEINDHYPFNISAFDDETERITDLEARGYTRWENHMVWMSHPLTALSAPIIPEGFAIRPFGGDAELEAYAALQRAAFQTETMTALWRRHTLHAPLYNPNIDLVAVAPDGRLAGFCIWWYQPASKIAQIEPLGVHPDFQQLGLSQALMAEGFRQVAALGAKTAYVNTYSFSEPALKSYEAAGFRVVRRELKYYKEY